MERKIIFTIMIVCLFATVEAQQIPVNNFYLQNPYIFNPAATGTPGNLTAYFDYSDQWTGLKGAPESANFGVHGLITKSMGLGVQLYTLKQGIFKQNSASLSYSYRLAIAENHTIGFGLSLGMHQNSISSSVISGENSIDPALYSTNFNEVLFKIGVGVHYNYKDLNVHLAAPVLYGAEEKQFLKNALAMASYDFWISEDVWLVRPAVFYRYASSLHTVDGIVSAEWNKRVMAQVGYRSNGNIITGVGVDLKGINIAYIYEINRTKLNVVSNGGHQIFVSYESPFSVTKKTPLYNNSRRLNRWD